MSSSRSTVARREALHYLHRGGGARCFHRDVKSANIVLTATLAPKLIDCGLAMYLPDGQPDESAGRGAGAAASSSPAAAERTTFAATGGVLGTPGYMCPKYARTGNFGEKSEVYSFGMVLLELLTGELQNARGRDLYGVFIEVRPSTHTPRPSSRSIELARGRGTLVRPERGKKKRKKMVALVLTSTADESPSEINGGRRRPGASGRELARSFETTNRVSAVMITAAFFTRLSSFE